MKKKIDRENESSDIREQFSIIFFSTFCGHINHILLQIQF